MSAASTASDIRLFVILIPPLLPWRDPN
jgi:hypothetical protein